MEEEKNARPLPSPVQASKDSEPQAPSSTTLVAKRPSAGSHRVSSAATLSYDPYTEATGNTNGTTTLQPQRRHPTAEARVESQAPQEKPLHNVDHHEHHERYELADAKHPIPLSKNRLRMWIATCLAFVILAPVISIVMGVTLHAREMRYPGDSGARKFDGRTIDFEVVLISADPKAGSMRMDWRILGEVNSPCSRDNVAACSDVEIMFDTNLLRAEGTHSTEEEILTSDRPSRPIFKFNATAFAIGDRAARTPTFRTQLALFSPDRTDSSLIFYPFDAYTAEIIFYAREAGTNSSVGVSISKSRGIAVGFETDFEHTNDPDVPPGLVEATITLTRSTLVKSYSIVSTLAIWTITIILALVMITTVFFGFKQRGEVLLIPVATLFAFTQLRQSMPGAPDGFGDVVDLVGLVPCLALLALTAAFSLATFILADPTDMPRQIRWKLIHDAFPQLKPEKDVEDKPRPQQPSSH